MGILSLAIKNLCKLFFASFIGLVIFVVIFPSLAVNAQVPQFINYQGKLKDASGTPLTGVYDFRMRIYDSLTGGNLLYGDEHTAVTVKSGGIFNVAIGMGSMLTPPGNTFSTLDFSEPYYITVEVGNGTWDGEMVPRIPLATYMYAFNSQQLDGHEAGNNANDVLLLDNNGDINFAGSIITPGNIESGAITIEGAENTAFLVFEDITNATTSGIYIGSGSPENVVTANTGSIFLDETGNAFIKESGTSNTGWTRLATVSNINNIYSSDGSLTGDRIISTNGNNLTFQGTQYSSIQLTSGDEIKLENYYSNISMGWEYWNMHMEQQVGGDFTDFDIGYRITSISSNYANFAGIQYGADYSANYTNRSLVDKGYVDSVINSGSATASNGLSKSGSDIQLGGTLTDDTTINHDGYSLIVREFAGAPYTVFNGDNFKIIDTGMNREVRFGIGNSDTTGITFEGTNEHNLFYRDDSIYVSSNLGTFIGMEYANDYSANYTNRSLVDKEYVDNNKNWVANGNALTTVRNDVSGGSANGDGSMAIGVETNASGWGTFVGGYRSIVSNNGAFAYGYDVTASGGTSVAFALAGGLGTKSPNIHMTALGTYNVGTDINTLFELGIGTDNSHRTNAVEIFTDGTINAPANTIALINSRGDKALVTKEYVEGAVLAATDNIYTTDGTLSDNRVVSTGGNELTFQGMQYSNIKLNNQDQIYLENYYSHIVMNSQNWNMHIEQDFGGDSTDFNIGHQVTSMSSSYANFAGIQYGSDYSANYTDRSLVDKAYVDGISAGSSPASNDGAIQYNNGGSFGGDDINFFWDDINNRLGIGTNTPDFALQVNGTIAPETADTLGLGTSALRWDLYANDADIDNLTVNDLFQAPTNSSAPASILFNSIY